MLYLTNGPHDRKIFFYPSEILSMVVVAVTEAAHEKRTKTPTTFSVTAAIRCT
jgi:hypothetical protein